MGADRVLEHLGLRTRLFAAPGWTVSQGTVTALPRNGFRLLAGLSEITDLVRDTTVRARVLGIGEGFLTEPWWCRTLVLSAERTARREAPCASPSRRAAAPTRSASGHAGRRRPRADASLRPRGVPLAAEPALDRRRLTRTANVASMADADVIVVGAGLAGSGRRVRSSSNGPPGPDRRPGERRQPGRPGVLVVRRPVLRRQPRTAQAGHPRQPRARAAGLARHGGFRPAGGPLAAAVGARLRRLRGGGEAQLAARTRAADLPAGRLGRTRRLRRPRTRQLGAALPRHLGHRAGDRRDLRPQAARPRPRSGSRTATVSTSWSSRAVPSPGCAAPYWNPRPPPAVWRRRETSSASSSSAPRRHRRQWRDRRQPRPGPQELARADGPGARAAAQRRARTRRRPDVRHQPRPPAPT